MSMVMALRTLGLSMAIAMLSTACERQSKSIDVPTKPGNGAVNPTKTPVSGSNGGGTQSGGSSGAAGGAAQGQGGGADPAGGGSSSSGGGGSSSSSGGGSASSGSSAGSGSGSGSGSGTLPGSGSVPPSGNGSTNVSIQTIIDDGTGSTIQWDGRSNQGNDRWDIVPVN